MCSYSNRFGYRRRFQILCLLALGSFLSSAGTAKALTWTWSGSGGDLNWSTIGNWGASAPPSSSTTDLAFAGTTNTGTALNPLNQNIAAPFQLNTLAFNNGAGSFFLGGGALTFVGAGNTITQLSSSAQSIANNISATTSATVTLTLAGSGSGVVTLSGIISAGIAPKDYAISKTGTSTFTLSGANTYGGLTTVSAGILNIQNATGLGTTALGTTVSSGASLQLQGGIMVGTEALNINGTGASGQTGALVNVSGTNNYGGLLTLAGATTLSSDSGTLNLTNAGTVTGATFGLTLAGGGDGSISSIIGTTTGGLTKNGVGTWTLSGAGANTYTGATTVNDGTLQLNKTGSVNAYGGTLTVGDGVGSGNSAITRLLAANEMPATTVTVNSDGLLDLNGFSDSIGALTISGGSVTTGAGTLTLGGTVTGNAAATSATISGSLALGGIRTFTINDGAAAVDLNVLAIVSGAFTVTKGGTGTMVFSGANTYTGATTVSAGTLNIQNATGLGTTAAGTTVSSGATLQLQGGITVGSETLSIAGTGAAGQTGALVNVSGTNNYGGLLTLTAATTLSSDSGTLNLTHAGTITGATFALTLGGAGNGTVSSIIGTTTGGLTKTGLGTWTLSGANTYTGATTVSAGVLNIQTATGLGTTPTGTTVSSGATLQLQGGVTVGTEALNINGTGASGQTGALVNVSGSNSYGGLLTLAGLTTLSSDSGTLSLTNAGTVTGATFGLTLAGAGNGSVSSIIGITTGGLTKTGAGTWTLSGANTYTGVTTLSGGILSVGTIGNGGVAGNLGQATNAATKLVFDGGTLRYTGVTASTDRNFTINTGKTATFDINANTLTVSGASTATNGVLTKIGSGTLVLSGANAYTGATNINVGTLKEGNANVIADTSAVTVTTGATYDLNSFSETIGSLAGGGTVTSGVAGALTLTAGGDNTSTLFSGVLQSGSGTISFTKSGTGTLTFSGANAYTGATMISAGVLNIQNATGLGTITAGTTVNSGAALQLQGGIAIGNETLALNGSGIASDGALRNISGTNSFAGAITLGSASTIYSDAGTLTLSGGIVTGGFTDTFGGAADILESGVISGTGALVKDGGGTSTLNGVNTYTGGTTINGGIVAVNSDSSLGASSGALTLNAGTLEVATSYTSTRNYTLGNVASTIMVDSGQTFTANGVFSGTGTLNKTGAGTLTLGGVNLFSGGTNVTAGVLQMSAINRLLSTADLTISGGTFDLQTFAQAAGVVTLTSGSITGSGLGILTGSSFVLQSGTVSAILASTGTVTKNTAGLVTLSGSNTFTGSTTISAGTLRVGSNNALGTTASGTTVASGAVLNLNNVNYSTAEPLTLNGNGISNGGALTNTGTSTFAGPINAATNATINVGGGILNLTGGLSKNGTTLTIAGGGTVNIMTNGITGSSPNSDFVIDGTDVVLSAASSYNGPTTIQSSGKLQLGNSNVLPTSPRTAMTINTSSTFDLASYSDGVASLTGDATAVVKNSVMGGTSTFTVNPANGVSTTFAGVIAGTNGGTQGNIALVKSGQGTLLLTGTNTYSGSTTINDGTLTAAGSSGSALGSTSSITVNSGGTLLLGANDQINNAATMTLAGGTFAKGEFSEGTAGTGGTSTLGLGALTLTASDSHLDFGTGTVGVLSFASFTPGAYTLTIDNWTGTANTQGNINTDRLIFDSNQFANLSSFSFTGFGSGATQFDLGGGYYEIAPVPVPEPSTYAAGLLALVGIGYLQRNQLRRALRFAARRGKS
ncbi:MAG: fibronectin-binding autotransporter adhesin [Verrucomicrobiota bacterium]